VLNKDSKINFNRQGKLQKASLTVEAALIMPLFLFFLIAFLSFIQIFTIQEQIQASITKMGLNLSRTAYFCKDFPDIEDILNFDQTAFGEEFDISFSDLADSAVSPSMLKLYALKYLDKDQINNSCIINGFEGISFYYSSILNDLDEVDIVAEYKVKIPVKIFDIGEMTMVQRVKLRSWTGFEVAAAYGTSQEDAGEEETIVYITTTGSVYHKDKNCSHIKLSVTPVIGIPTELRNESGSKYKMCDSCCTGNEGELATYYITSYGTKYHSRRDCPAIKRNVKEIPLSEAGGRSPCKRCGN
jgi:hypothetical protein